MNGDAEPDYGRVALFTRDFRLADLARSVVASGGPWRAQARGAGTAGISRFGVSSAI